VNNETENALAISENEELENVETETIDQAENPENSALDDNAESAADSALAVSSGDAVTTGGTTAPVIVTQDVDLSGIESMLESVDERLERMEVIETYVSDNSVAFIGSDVTDYDTTNGLLLCILIAVILAVLFNNTRRW